MMATSHIEIPQEKLKQMVLFVLIACSLLLFSLNYNFGRRLNRPRRLSQVQYSCVHLVYL
jgi:hypothetical protein